MAALDALHPEVERWSRVAALFAFNFAGYYLIGLSGDPAGAARLHTRLDDAIPFLPWTEVLYFSVYTAMLYPAFVVRDRLLFRRVTHAYLAVICVSLLCWWVFPVTAIGLRADPTTLDPAVFWEWGVRANYALDPPFNMFPSLHLSIATLAGLCGWTARRAFGLAAAPVVAGIAVSICTVKQHYAVDGLAGLVLGTAAWAALVRRAPEAALPQDERATGWGGPLAWAGFTALVYLAALIAWRLGWRPWE